MRAEQGFRPPLRRARPFRLRHQRRAGAAQAPPQRTARRAADRGKVLRELLTGSHDTMSTALRSLDCLLAWERHRARRPAPARGLLLVAAGGLGDAVLLAHVLPRF